MIKGQKNRLSRYGRRFGASTTATDAHLADVALGETPVLLKMGSAFHEKGEKWGFVKRDETGVAIQQLTMKRA